MVPIKWFQLKYIVHSVLNMCVCGEVDVAVGMKLPLLWDFDGSYHSILSWVTLSEASK